MHRMNAHQRWIALLFVIKRDGARCNNTDGVLFDNPRCRQVGDEHSLILDHVDNNPANNNPTNWQALCRSCNTKKNPRGFSKRGQKLKALIDGHHKMRSIVRESEREKIEDDKRPNSAELEKNMRCERRFRSWIVTEIMDKSKLTLTDAIDGGAETVDCSQQTIQRYLRKLCSVAGILCIVVIDECKWIQLKPEYLKLSPTEILEQQARNWKDEVVGKLKSTCVEVNISEMKRD